MSKLDELIATVAEILVRNGDAQAAKVHVRTYIEERFGPLMSSVQWDCDRHKPDATAPCCKALARAKEE